MMTLASLAPNLTRVLGSRMTGATEAALPRLIDLANLFSDQQIAPILQRLLDHQDHDIRSQVIQTLGRLKSPESVEPLAQVLLSKSWFASKKTKALKMEALRALAEIQTEEARAVLEQIVSTGSGELQEMSRQLLEKS
jgi:HEAT repeat protein